MLKNIRYIGAFVLILLLASCTGPNRAIRSDHETSFPDRIIAGLTPDIEALYLTWHDLDQIYKDMKFLERGLLFAPDDRQLGYIQKVGLYIQDASVRTHHRWEQLSVLAYIRPGMLRDYLTLSVNALTATIGEIGYDDRFIAIYAGFIQQEAFRADIDRARAKMEEAVDLLKRLRGKLTPAVD
jgi:hypothetical protein